MLAAAIMMDVMALWALRQARLAEVPMGFSSLTRSPVTMVRPKSWADVEADGDAGALRGGVARGCELSGVAGCDDGAVIGHAGGSRRRC